jgi:ribosomal protein S18 acetylase RimI-like enzyme
VVRVAAEGDVRTVRKLFSEYAGSLGFDLCFQNFEEELNSLPGSYSQPTGALYLGWVDGTAAGCIGLRPFSDCVGELKRLYVIPAFRGRGLARLLVSSAVDAARSIGYSALVLDTVATMRPAIALYESFGFRRTDPYYSNPLPDVLYFRKALQPCGAQA